ncbi:MAG: DUF3256 family protein [Prevotella sp.]|nr:DUF3256 family protein [Prevotella sp.]
MRKLLMIGILLSLLCSPCEAQRKMRDVFLQMPDSLLPYLTENNRLDFLDFMDSGMKAEVHNELGGRSEMLSLSDEMLTLQVSHAMKVVMRLVPVAEAVDSCQQVICMITTYGTEAPESKIEVYSVQWNPIDVSTHLTLPDGPYTAEFKEAPQPSVGLSLRQANMLDPIANEEQKKEQSWLKYIEWKP